MTMKPLLPPVKKTRTEYFFCLEMLCFVVYPSNCHIICDVGGGAPLAWYESRGTGRCFSFPIVLPVPESSPPPVNWPGL